jgi:cysteine desulfurase/selenocysteine lyase
VDGAQAVRHEPVDMQEMDCDYYCFSGHKVLAPTGIGTLYVKNISAFKPSFFGGGIVDTVEDDKMTLAAAPICFEPGTPNYFGAVALASALDTLQLRQGGHHGL